MLFIINIHLINVKDNRKIKVRKLVFLNLGKKLRSDVMDGKSFKVPVSFQEVLKAEKVVYQYLKPTQLIYYGGLSDLIGAEIYIKHENHHPGGSFKIRGGVNVMHHLNKAGIKGVITFSTGNHGISVATAAKWFGLEAVVVVPKGNNPVKNQLIKNTGAELIEAGETFDEAAKKVERLRQDKNLYYIHAANEPHLINGVGTEFLEIAKDLPNINTIILPIGAGSEVAAAVTVLKQLNPNIDIIAVQAEKSQAAYLSWKNKMIQTSKNKTFAGGFATGTAYELPFQIYKDSLADFVLLTEVEIKEGIALALKYTNNLAEGAGAATITAAVKIREKLKGKKVVLQMSGSNIDLNILKEVTNNYL